MKLKRIMASILAICMVLSTMSFAVFAEENAYVAKVGDVECADASAMISALNSALGDVTVEIYGKVVTSGFGLNNSNITKLSFVAESDDAEICVDGVSYIDVRNTNYPIEYTGLILSHVNAGQNIDGFLPQYFSTYNGGNVTYTECTFPNGVTACGSVADTTYTFTECIFNNTTSGLYSLWIYGNSTNVVVNGGEFCGVRGIKMYSEGSDDFSSLSVSGATFSDKITEKHAVVLTKGESVTLTNNTFNNTKGIVQVDDEYASSIDGKTVTIDGTEYTVDSENLTLEDSTPAETIVATINGNGYETLQTAVDEANGSTITLVDDAAEEIQLADGATVVIDLGGKKLSGCFKPFKGSLTLSNGTIDNDNSSYSAIEINEGELSLENVNVTSTRHAVRIDGAVSATINGGTYKSDATEGTRHAVNVSGAANVTIKNGTFVGPKGTTMDSGSAVCVQNGATVTIKGGNFTGGKNDTLGVSGTMTVYGGIFDQNPTVYVAEGYAALPDLNGSYVVGKAPTATVNNLGATVIPAGDYDIYGSGSNTVDMPLSFVMQFLADQTEADMETSPYADWYGDFVITFEGLENDSFIADGCYLAGFYGDFGWVKVPVDGMTIEDGARYPVMLGVGLGQKYEYICSGVQDFKCALYLTPEILAENPDLKVNLELNVVDSSNDAKALDALQTGKNIYKASETSYTVEDFKSYVAQIGEVKYTSLQDAIDAAQDGDVITVLADINLANTELQLLDGSYDTYFLVEGKSVTINLNGKTISGAYTGTNTMLVGVFSTDNNGHLTITGNGTVDVTATNKVYSLITNYEDGCTITIENGTYKLDKASDNLIYSGGKTDAAVTVKDGTFMLGNVGTGENGKPWIFNVLGAGDHYVLVNGGTFNADINRQHWSNEVVVPETHYTVKNTDDTYTVKEGAVAYVNEGMLTGPYFVRKNIGYETIDEALAAADQDDTVTIFAGDYTGNLSVEKDITVVGETDAEGNNLVNISGKLNITADGATVKNINIKNGSSTAGYISAKDVTVEGCSVVGGNGFRYCYTSGTVTFKDSVITGSTYGIHFDGSAGGNIVIDNCTITGWTSFARTIEKVTISKTEFAKGNYNQLRFYQDVEITDSKFNPDMTVDFGKENVNLDITNCSVADGSPITDVIYLADIATMGVEVTVDGEAVVIEASVLAAGETEAKYYLTLADAVAAAESGEIITILKDGEYELPHFTNKELTFKGASKDGVIINDAPDANDQNWRGSSIHFENLTAKGATANYHGLANGVVEVTYQSCNINGLRFLYAPVTFEGCTFNANNVEHSFWTYGSSSVTVKNCTFTYTDRAVNCYSENGATHEADISFSDCTFTYAGTAEAPEGAVEINSGSSKSIDLTMTDCTAPAKGAMWFNSKWDSTGGANTTVTVNGTQVWPAPVYVAQIGDTKYTSLQTALDAAAAGTGNVTVDILEDINLTNVDWSPVTVSAPGYPVVTVNGNNKTITGLNDMLFAGTWAGKSGLIINDLTIKDSNIVNDKDDAKGTVGVGAFIGYPQASATITLNNCHLVNSSVSGGHWTGGLIGMAGGYNGNDGPVFMNLTIKDCSVTGSTITGKGSAGGVIGHGSCAAWTNVVIEDTTVSGNTITSTGSSTNRAGAVMGTIGAAGQPTTADGETKTGGASVSATVSGNTVTSNSTPITTIYGRQGTETGMLYVTGGTYDNYPIEENVTYAQPKEGYEIIQNDDNTYGIEKAAELFEFYQMNLDLESSIKVNYYILASYFEGTDYYAKIVHSSANGDITETVDFADWGDNSNNKYKQISYTGLVAKNMADTITITIHDGNGKQVSVAQPASIKTYAESYLKQNAGKDDKWVTSFVDMLNYGAEAQKYFNYNTENLANAGISKYQEYGTQTDVELTNSAAVSGPVYQANLDLENRIVYNGYFKDVTSDMTAEVSYTDHIGNPVTYAAPIVKSGSYYKVAVDKLVIADANQLITITVKDGSGNEYAYIKDTVNSYLCRVIPTRPDFESLARAMAKFTASAHTALHTEE